MESKIQIKKLAQVSKPCLPSDGLGCETVLLATTLTEVLACLFGG